MIFKGYYKNLVNNNTDYRKKDNSININLIHFIAICVMYVILGIFILVLTNLVTEAEFQFSSIKEYSLMISDIPKDFSSVEDLKQRILEVDGLMPLDVILTFKFSEFVEMKKDYKELKHEFRELQEADVSALLLTII